MTFDPRRPSDLGNDAARLQWAPPAEFHEADPNCLDIGLVNNMPDAALRSTERQFRALLDRAADPSVTVRLRIFTLPDVPRSEMGRQLTSEYLDVSELWSTRLDGLVVTGTEPRTERLQEEPYWQTLTRVMDWAEENTASTVWSCLAAHAAPLYLDGIERRRLPEKRFGIFDCSHAAEHPLTSALPARYPMPHSRWNDMDERDLEAAGYRVLTRSDEAGADIFIKERRSLFVFLQGHPEYEADSLLLEYRRDIGRFLRNERESYPGMPNGYFDDELVSMLEALRDKARAERREELLASFPLPLAASRVTSTWRSAAAALYRNWLRHLAARKARHVAAL